MGRPTKSDGLSRREQILSEAQKLFVAQGISHVTTRQIAQAVGISQPSLYAHFPTRESIGVELCCRAFDDLYQCLSAAAVDEGTSRERLYRLGREYIDFGLRRDAAYRVAFMMEMPVDDGDVKTRILEAGLRAFAVLRSLFASITGRDDFATDTAAQSAWASMHGLVSIVLARPEFPFVDHDTLIHAHLTIICDAVVGANPV